MSGVLFEQRAIFIRHRLHVFWRNVSQLSRAAGAEIGEGQCSEAVKSAGFCVPLDRFVKARSIKRFKPSPELRQLIRGQFGERPFDVFNRLHGRSLSK